MNRTFLKFLLSISGILIFLVACKADTEAPEQQVHRMGNNNNSEVEKNEVIEKKEEKKEGVVKDLKLKEDTNHEQGLIDETQLNDGFAVMDSLKSEENIEKLKLENAIGQGIVNYFPDPIDNSLVVVLYLDKAKQILNGINYSLDIKNNEIQFVTSDKYPNKALASLNNVEVDEDGLKEGFLLFSK